VQFTRDTTAGPVRLRTFNVSAGGRKVPVALWTPVHDMGPRPLVCIGHGGSAHKTAAQVTDIALPLVERHHFAVAVIDGPIHGERRGDWSDANPPVGLHIRDEFLAHWQSGTSIDPMVADWRGALDALVGLPDVAPEAIGWYGLSMGTAYGLPLVAADRRFCCALLGMWGGDYVNSQRLMDDAPMVQCPVLFQQKWNDELFTREGQVALFDRLGAADKRLKVYMGPHAITAGEQSDDIIAFLVARVSAAFRPRGYSPAPALVQACHAVHRLVPPQKQDAAAKSGIPIPVSEMIAAKDIRYYLGPPGASTAVGSGAQPAVAGMAGLSVYVVECPPGNGPPMHSHNRTVETFFCVDGRFEIAYGARGECLHLDPLDMISVPRGVMRRFRNVSDQVAHLLVMIQGDPDQHGDIGYASAFGAEIAQKFGAPVVAALEKVGFSFTAD